MTEYVIPEPKPVSLSVQGTLARFPVRRIYCVGRNYSAHVREMGGDPSREVPFFFQKPTDAVVESGSSVAYPSVTNDFQHEVELLLAIGVGGRFIPTDDALNHVYGIGVAIDLTRRDVQVEARKAGRPWEIGKSFDASAACSEIVPVKASDVPRQRAISLRVNGELRQSGDLEQMVWSPAEIIHHLSTHYQLQPGDLIMTGTPAGVGPMAIGDQVDAVLEGVATLRIFII